MHNSRRLAFLLLIAATQVRAVPPLPSLSGMIYHDQVFNDFTTPYEDSIQLNSDGTFTFIRQSQGNPTAFQGPVSLVVPPQNGTYSYVVNADSTATLTLKNPAGTVLQTRLTFTSATAGTVANMLASLSTFYLTTPGQFSTSPALNLSVRGTVSPGHPLVAGLVVPGTDPREYLIRVVGPGLSRFGVTNVWAAPTLQLSTSASAYNDEIVIHAWGRLPASTPSVLALQLIFPIVGAFPLTVGSADNADVVRLMPGAYTLQAVAGATGISGGVANDPGGDVLIEAYAMP